MNFYKRNLNNNNNKSTASSVSQCTCRSLYPGGWLNVRLMRTMIKWTFSARYLFIWKAQHFKNLFVDSLCPPLVPPTSSHLIPIVILNLSNHSGYHGDDFHVTNRIRTSGGQIKHAGLLAEEIPLVRKKPSQSQLWPQMHDCPSWDFFFSFGVETCVIIC